MSKEVNLTRAQVDYLLSPTAIRDQAKNIFDLTLKDEMLFRFHPEKLKPTVDYVLSVIKRNYPSLDIPFHSRWGHFRVGGVDRVKRLDEALSKFDKLERARIKLDLVITSVLLDAGAGAAWSYFEKETQKSFSRSEGLGLASLNLFLSGALSSNGQDLRADKEGLRKLSVADLNHHFQVSEKNPLIGVEGRKQLLNNLALALENKKIFKEGRPGNILDYLNHQFGSQIPAQGILRAVLDGLGPIWPGRLVAQGVNLGDIWQHSKLQSRDALGALVPFHKLSQWMTYSLIEPLLEAGFSVIGVEELTGLAEYRNGGLMIDSGLISVKEPESLQKAWSPDSDLVIEWRALTVHLLDQIGSDLQKSIGRSPKDFPLAKVLEGGTWWAGRFLAKDKRDLGDPPLQIKSDGTVF